MAWVRSIYYEPIKTVTTAVLVLGDSLGLMSHGKITNSHFHMYICLAEVADAHL